MNIWLLSETNQFLKHHLWYKVAKEKKGLLIYGKFYKVHILVFITSTQKLIFSKISYHFASCRTAPWKYCWGKKIAPSKVLRIIK